MSNGFTGSNLDYLAAKHAQNMIRRLIDDKRTDVDKAENIFTKALGVLQENGIYACFLYLLAKEKKEGGQVVAEEMLNLLYGLRFDWVKQEKLDVEAILNFISDKVTCGSLERLILAKEILEHMFIYARYGVKARG